MTDDTPTAAEHKAVREFMSDVEQIGGWVIVHVDSEVDAYEPTRVTLTVERLDDHNTSAFEVTTDSDAKTVKNVCRNLEGDEPVPVEKVIDTAVDQTGLERDEVVAEIENLKKKGELYEPTADNLRAT